MHKQMLQVRQFHEHLDISHECIMRTEFIHQLHQYGKHIASLAEKCLDMYKVTNDAR